MPMCAARRTRATGFRTDCPFEFSPSLSMRQNFGKNSQTIFSPNLGRPETHHKAVLDDVEDVRGETRPKASHPPRVMVECGLRYALPEMPLVW